MPRSVDVRPHPHIGLSTVTYLFEGEIIHRDSVGSELAITPGEVNWMTAGRGITHSERFDAPAPRRAGPCTASRPGSPCRRRTRRPTRPSPTTGRTTCRPTKADGLWARLIAGEAFGAKAKVKTHSPMFYVHWRLKAGAKAQLPAEYPERAAYVAAGAVEIDGRTFRPGQMAGLRRRRAGAVHGRRPTPRHAAGRRAGRPALHRVELRLLVARTRIEQAKADWRAGRMKLPDLDHDEFIPLPADPPPPANPMS